MCPFRLPTITRPPSMVGDDEMAPRPSTCQILVPELTRYAATTPPPRAATTTPPATAGVPLTPPLSSTCHAGFRCLAASTPSVAPAGWPSRASSPRYMGQSAAALEDGDAEGAVSVPHAPSRTAAIAAQAARRRVVLLAAVNRLRVRRRRFARADPSVEHRQRTRSPPVGAAEESHHRRHDEDPDDRRVNSDRDGETDADGFDDHDIRIAKSEEHRDHDQGGAGDEAAALLQARRHAGLVVARSPVLLLDAADQEHLVVHRHAEDDAEEDDRNAGIDRLWREVEQAAQVSLLKHPHHGAERGRDREQVGEHGLQGQYH